MLPPRADRSPTLKGDQSLLQKFGNNCSQIANSRYSTFNSDQSLLLHSVGANATHGLRRTNQDKRRAVEMLLNDPEWSGWSDRDIAKTCGVHHTFVGKLRSSLELNTSDNTPTTR